jgi:L-ascorbate metabolism protein UlaG (beta-lactamase superfamily)
MDNQPSSLRLRWLGLAGLEIDYRQQKLVIDPCFSRFAVRRMWLGGLNPAPGAAARLPGCDYILVTHAHWDHMLDAPPLARACGATLAGSHNAITLASVLGVPANLLRQVSAQEHFSLGDFDIQVLAAEHEKVPGFGCGALRPGLAPPLKARDYRPDACFCYRISVGGMSLSTDPGLRPQAAGPTDVLLLQPHRRPEYYRRLLADTSPRLVIPIHWDSLFHFAAEPPRSYWRPELGFPPLKKVDLNHWADMIRGFCPTARVIVPRPFESYSLPLVV